MVLLAKYLLDFERFDNMNFCKNCNKEISSAKTYCNNSCQLDYQHKQYIDRWKDGKEDGMVGKYQISKYIKRYLFDKYNYRCSRCGWSQMNQHTKKIPLEVEHIDGNYRNNSEENLTLLCPNCHSLTPTYKGANRGNGRQEREKYR